MLVLRLLLMLQAGFVVFLEAHNEVPELNISADKSFKLRVFISHVKKNAPKRYRYMIDEAYSSEQKRTIIKHKTLTSNRDDWFKTAQVPYDGTVIVDGDTRPPLIVFANFINKQWCKELEWWKFEQMSHIDVIKSLSDNKQMLDDKLFRIHGPSNILFWFEQVRDQLEPVKETLGVSVRDVPSDMYKHPFTGPESAQTYTYYAKSQIGKGGKGMPLRVTIDYPEGSFVQYDFISPAEVNNGPGQLSDGDYFANELILDEFFIPRASGCSLAGNHSDFTLSNHVRQHDSFSFEARAEAFLAGRDMMSRVAYHKALNLMRVDRQTGIRGSNQLVDFNRGRTYRSLTRAREGPEVKPRMTRFFQPHEIVAGNCRMIASAPNEANIELVLFGSQGSWRYLGLARLRGLRVRAYEAYDTQWPMWLQQPVLFSNQDNIEIRSQAAGPGIIMSTVIYMLDGEGDEKFAKETYNLAGIEIFFIRESNREVISSRSISIVGFDWQVNQLAGWSRTSAIFSMADQCAANLESNEHLQVSMSVVRADNPSVDDGLKSSLLVNKNRDLSLLQTIQNDLGLPSSMLYDLRSEATYQKEATNLMPMSMTFRLAKSRQPLVRLRLYGTGTVKEDLRSELIILQTSLRDCYNLAAHQKFDTFFGYSSKKSLCNLDLSKDSSISNSQQQSRPRAFDLSKEGNYDIYLVRHVVEETEPDLVTELRDLSRRSAISDSQLMKRFLVPNPSQTMIKISFIIKSFQIFDSNDGPRKFGTKNLSGPFNLGLVPDSNLVNLLEAGRESSNSGGHKKAIDFVACQMACLLDTNCASFSYCLRGSQVECALTSVDFNDANLVFQLIDHFKEQPTDGRVEGREFSLKVDLDKQVRVKQQAACQLSTKSYLNLYRKSNKELKVNFENVIIESAPGGREDCARKCFSETEKALKKLSNVTDKISWNLEEIMANQDRVLDGAAGEVHRHRLQASSELCQGFHYLDAINLSLLPDNALTHFERAMRDLDKNFTDTGFCCTRKPSDQRKPAVDGRDPEKTVVNFEEFYFRFETIYEKRPGLRLLEGMKTPREHEIFRQLSVMGELPNEPGDIDVLKDIITRRENTQNSLMNGFVDETICAEACTLQTLGPWPACRSFDIVILPRGINGTNTICKLNSISYADAVEARRTDLIDVKNNHVKIQTHYEPKFNIEGLARWRSDPRKTPNRSLTWATSIIVVLGLITGLSGGIFFGLRNFIVRNSEETLIEDTQHSSDDVENSFNLASLHLAS